MVNTYIVLFGADVAGLTPVASFLVLLLMAATVLGAMGAAVPQLFSLARAVLGEGAAGQRSTPLLRSALVAG
jgi:SET family sugar efflux transporter-like MFS transporter